jgi:hypothetical protein
MKIRLPTFTPKIPYDKKLHFIAGLLICIIASITVNPTYGLAFAMTAGVFKEIYDWYDYGGPDVYDCIATWLGGWVGYAVAMMIM